MAETTFDIVARVLADQLSLDAEEITLESDINADLGADSLDAVELIMSLEEEFGITIDASDSESLKLISDVVELVDSLK